MKITRHPETFVGFDELLNSPKRPYLPTYGFKGYINKNHKYYSKCPVDGLKIIDQIEGSLRREDALKLYEMAYFANGDILELGTNRGLSASIMSRANHDSGLKKSITTIDLEERYVEVAEKNLRRIDLLDEVSIVRANAIDFMKQLSDKGRNFTFAFVDHSHEYELVLDAASRMKDIIVEGGFCLFHDFKDRRNAIPEEEHYGVYQGAVEGMDGDFEFYGVYGCTGLFRKK